jgi:alkylation response protein AidB-like acyl-CoA dehydrogenase
MAAIAVGSTASDVDGAIELARSLGTIAEPPGSGSTRDLWEALATIAAADLGVARVIEPHLDALAILRQARFDSAAVDLDQRTWGVFAAEGGDDPLNASETNGEWSLTGTKPWCSLASRLDSALVTAHMHNGDRALFAIDLNADGVRPASGQWHARGLVEIPSGPVVFLDAGAMPVREPGWYLSRPGFAWGGIGVAACWYGGAVGIGRTLFAIAGPTPPPLIAAHLGAVDEELQSARSVLGEAAAFVDAHPTDPDGGVLAKRVRATVARVCESVIFHAAHALGPAPLALDAAHAKRVADLQLYVRQHHAEKDDASLGSTLAGREGAPW